MISVVIPTFNRQRILQRTLAALLAQDEAPGTFEIIVVDDGSTDDTTETVLDLAGRSPVNLCCLRQENSGAGAARNRGIDHAKGRIVLLLDDDIIASPQLLREHRQGHGRYPQPTVAILGRVALSPEIPDTPLNRRHAVHRWQLLRDGQEIDWRYFFTGNISLKRSFLRQVGCRFDESLPHYEDTEMGYRCSRHGLRLIYQANALGLHYHDLSLSTYLRLSERYGESLAMLHRRYPELRTQLGAYLPFSWRHPPQRILRDLVRPLVLNQVTVSGMLLLSREAQRRDRELPNLVAQRIGNYYERRGYRRASQHRPQQ